jgi:hypothetical protein
VNILKFQLGERSYEQSARLRAKLAQWLGRPSGQLAGTFVTEMAGLRKVLYLCNGCHTKFSERRNQYRRAARPPLNKGCISTCDGCREWGDCEIYLPEERY